MNRVRHISPPRRFAKLGLMALAATMFQPAAAESIQIQPRYYRWHVDPGVEWVETNTGHATLDWELPLEQCALVLVDVWDAHYLLDASERGEQVVQDRIVPLLAAARAAGLRVIHAPSPEHARACGAAWIGHDDRPTTGPRQQWIDKTWPPRAFREKSGPYARYARPTEPRASELAEFGERLAMHPEIQPIGDEVAIASGDELHRYCREQGILFLFYAGFNTNACIQDRDYGVNDMGRRGYEIVLLRDATTGMEAAWSQAALAQTEHAILRNEMFGKYSIESGELIDALENRHP